MDRSINNLSKIDQDRALGWNWLKVIKKLTKSQSKTLKAYRKNKFSMLFSNLLVAFSMCFSFFGRVLSLLARLQLFLESITDAMNFSQARRQEAEGSWIRIHWANCSPIPHVERKIKRRIGVVKAEHKIWIAKQKHKSLAKKRSRHCRSIFQLWPPRNIRTRSFAKPWFLTNVDTCLVGFRFFL